MTQPVYGADSREPFIHNGKRVPYTEKRTLKDGSIVYDFLGPRDANGKRKRKTFKNLTPTDAVREIERHLPVTRAGTVADRTIKLEPLYYGVLAAMKDGSFTHSEGSYSPRTIELFEQRAVHVLDALGSNMTVADIKVGHLRAMMKRLKEKGLGGSYIRGCLSCASTMLRYAVEQEVRDENPANKIGRGERPSAKRKTEPRYISIPQAELLFSKMSDESRPIAVTMFYAATRITETLDLRWSDFAGQLNVDGTKTRASDGTVPLLPRLQRELRAHRERMGKRGIHFIAPDALVFQTFRGKPISRRNVLRAVHQAGSKAGLNPEGKQPVGCHDLRHSALANTLAINGGNMVEASKFARHANPQVTAQIYADLVDDGVEALAQKLVAGGFGA